MTLDRPPTKEQLKDLLERMKMLPKINSERRSDDIEAAAGAAAPPSSQSHKASKWLSFDTEKQYEQYHSFLKAQSSRTTILFVSSLVTFVLGMQLGLLLVANSRKPVDILILLASICRFLSCGFGWLHFCFVAN